MAIGKNSGISPQERKIQFHKWEVYFLTHIAINDGSWAEQKRAD